MNRTKKILILYSRLSDYILNSFDHFTCEYEHELHIVKKEIDPEEAPFYFDLRFKNCHFFNESDFNEYSLLEFTKKLRPNLIICSGWANKKYNFLVRSMHKTIDCVLVMDNQWNGTIRQYLGLLYIRNYLVPRFKKIWVPGKLQMMYAMKLGFKEEQIHLGFYVANKNIFYHEKGDATINNKFVFVGRYSPEKGIENLINAFLEASETKVTNWELHCIGTGNLKGKLPKHPKIKHLGFLQPEELKSYSKERGVFVLPSHFEPWGLVVQEFALAGCPLIVSDKVGSGAQFVTEENGIIFRAGDKKALVKALLKFMDLTKSELEQMSKISIKKGLKINNDDWSNTLLNLLK